MSQDRPEQEKRDLFEPTGELKGGYDMGMAQAFALEHAKKTQGEYVGEGRQRVPLIWNIESSRYDEDAECFKVVLSCQPEGVEPQQKGMWEYHVRSTGGLMPGTPLLRQSLRYTLAKPKKGRPWAWALLVLVVLGLTGGGTYAAVTLAGPGFVKWNIRSVLSPPTATPPLLFRPTSTPVPTRPVPTATAVVLMPTAVSTRPTATPTLTPRPTPSPVSTPRPTGAIVPLPTPTATARPTLTPVLTPTLRPTPTPTAVPTATVGVLASDSFNRPDADRCALGQANNALGGSGAHFYSPIWGGDKPTGANIVANVLQNNGLDYGGVQFARAQTCSRLEFPGENVGQDLNIRVDLLVPTDAAGHVTQAGPYFRSRLAAPGDGLVGGTSAGYWVQLHSTGEVKVKRLNPAAVVATSVAATVGPAAFDSKAFHTLEIAVQGTSLQVALDGRLLTFNQDGKQVTTVAIPPTWDGPPVVGFNQGAAGIAFGAEDNRGLIGGQRADNLVVTKFRSLAIQPAPIAVVP